MRRVFLHNAIGFVALRFFQSRNLFDLEGNSSPQIGKRINPLVVSRSNGNVRLSCALRTEWLLLMPYSTIDGLPMMRTSYGHGVLTTNNSRSFGIKADRLLPSFVSIVTKIPNNCSPKTRCEKSYWTVLFPSFGKRISISSARTSICRVMSSIMIPKRPRTTRRRPHWLLNFPG